MIPIAKLLTDIGQAAETAVEEFTAPRGALVDPGGLVRRIIAGESRRRTNEARLAVPVPRFCVFSVTWRCNLSCVGCYAKNYRHHGDMPLEAIERIIREASDLGSYLFVIVGGEPLMVDGLLETIAGADGALFFLFTNATLMTHGHADALAGAANILPVVSVEGSSDLTDARRGNGVAVRAAKAAGLLRDAGAPFGLAAMVTHRNVTRVTSRPWFDEIWDDGARFCFLIDYVPFPHDLEPGFVLTDDDLADKAEALEARYAEARPLVMNFPPDEYRYGPCQCAGNGFLHINADGYVEPCPFSHYAADNVLTKPLSEILGSPFFSELRQQARSLDNPRGECLLWRHDKTVAQIARRTGALCTERPRTRI